jgi:hypothetical protein
VKRRSLGKRKKKKKHVKELQVILGSMKKGEYHESKIYNTIFSQ